MNLDQIIAKLIIGKADKEELHALEDWKKESEDNISMLKDSMRINELSNHLHDYKEVDTHKAWSKVESRMTPDTKVFKINRWAKIAAALVAIVAMVWMFNDTFFTTETPVQTYLASEVKDIKLSDGSLISMDANSKLTELQVRTVTLDGRAYFDITPDKNSPFTVQVFHGALTVLGTEFNINTNAQFTQIYVTEGKVKHSYLGKEYVLEVGDMLSIRDNKATLTKTESPHLVAWKSQSLTFKDESLLRVLESVAVYYKVALDASDVQESNDKCKINTTYSKETIEQVLTELSILAGLKYEFKNNKITVKSFKC